MADFHEIYEIAETIDLSPQRLADADFRRKIRDTLEVVNGRFIERAVDRGIEARAAETWIHATEEVARRTDNFGVEAAADLSVRLTALSYILSDQETELDPELDPADLLASATPEDAS